MLAVNAMLNVSVSGTLLLACSMNNLVRPLFALTTVQSYCSFRVPFVKLSPSNVMHAHSDDGVVRISCVLSASSDRMVRIPSSQNSFHRP